MGTSSCLTWVRQCDLPVCAVFFVGSSNCMTASVWDFLMRVQMLMHAIAHAGSMDTITESALEADPGRKMPCCIWVPNPCQYCAWHFRLALHHLSYPCSFMQRFKDSRILFYLFKCTWRLFYLPQMTGRLFLQP